MLVWNNWEAQNQELLGVDKHKFGLSRTANKIDQEKTD